MRWMMFAGLFSLAVCAAIMVEAAWAGELKEGAPAPAVDSPATQIGAALPDKKGAKTLSLQDFKGKKNVVLFFFPKAMTGG